MRPHRRPNPRRVKMHYNYTIAEASDLLGVCRNSVRNWIRLGLETIRVRGMILILGEELRRLLTHRQAKRRVRCPPGSMFCLKCRDARRPPAGMVEQIALTPTTVNLRGLCPDCGNLMHRRASLARLGDIGFGDLTPHAGGLAPNR